MRAGRARALLALAAVGGAGALAVSVPEAKADTGIGCKTDLWGFLGSQRRTLCDGPVRADGTWQRVRTIWTPAHQVPLTCSDYYVFTCTGGYFVRERVNSSEQYPVSVATVLPDEPAHLVGVS